MEEQQVSASKSWRFKLPLLGVVVLSAVVGFAGGKCSAGVSVEPVVEVAAPAEVPAPVVPAP